MSAFMVSIPASHNVGVLVGAVNPRMIAASSFILSTIMTRYLNGR